MKVYYDNKLLNTITTNHSMTNEEAIELTIRCSINDHEALEAMQDKEYIYFDDNEQWCVDTENFKIEWSEKAPIKSLVGMKWSDLTEEQQSELLLTAKAIDGRTASEPEESMKCIIDFFGYEFSIEGKFIEGEDENEIIINSEAVFY